MFFLFVLFFVNAIFSLSASSNFMSLHEKSAEELFSASKNPDLPGGRYVFVLFVFHKQWILHIFMTVLFSLHHNALNIWKHLCFNEYKNSTYLHVLGCFWNACWYSAIMKKMKEHFIHLYTIPSLKEIIKAVILTLYLSTLYICCVVWVCSAPTSPRIML